jgi:hypothetical protein
LDFEDSGLYGIPAFTQLLLSQGHQGLFRGDLRLDLLPRGEQQFPGKPGKDLPG